MKKTFALIALVSLCASFAQAQSKIETTRQSEVAEKASLKTAQPESKKIENTTIAERAASAKRVNSNMVLTEEQVKARSKQKEAAAKTRTKTSDNK